MLDTLQRGFQSIVKKVTGKGHVSESNIKDSIEEVKQSLLEADVNVRVVRRFVNRTVEQALGTEVLRSLNPGQQFIKILNDNLVQFLGEKHQDIELQGNPATLLMCGLQGSGKTTSSAKLALYYKNAQKTVALLALDLTRPAAIQQLEQLGEKIAVPVITRDTLGLSHTVSLEQIVQKAQQHAKQQGYEVLIIDTAGRTELDQGLLNEIGSIQKVTKSCARILVLDALTGQTAVDIAKNFHSAVELTGLIFTKVDSDARGGALLSVKTAIGIPVHFIGSGETMEALEPFHPDRMASRILGMGDVVSLVEKVQGQVDQEQAEKLQKKILKKTFTLQDYLEQMQQITKIGSLDKIAAMMPGMSADQLQNIDTKQVRREEAILLSMTMRERENPKILGFSRRSRIAKGSGNTVAKVNALLKKFEKMRQMMKKTIKDPKKAASLFGNVDPNMLQNMKN